MNFLGGVGGFSFSHARALFLFRLLHLPFAIMHAHLQYTLHAPHAQMRHQELSDTTEDQLSLAAIHYLRSHFQEATDIYKRLLLENRDDLALNVFVAMCYYKLDYYDVSLEILAVYLQVRDTPRMRFRTFCCPSSSFIAFFFKTKRTPFVVSL